MACDILISKSKQHIDVERVFEAKTFKAGETIKTVIRVCLCFKTTMEFALKRNQDFFNIELQDDMSSEKLFGTLLAFVSRCEDLLEICYTNQEFLG